MSEPAELSPPAAAVVLAQDLRSVVFKLKRRLREQAHAEDLAPSHSAVLLRLEKDGPATTSALARAEAMRPQSMGTIVAALEAAGLVTGSPDPADGRQTIIAITEECRARLVHGRAVRQDWLARTIDGALSPDELTQLAASIPLLRRLIGE